MTELIFQDTLVLKTDTLPGTAILPVADSSLNSAVTVNNSAPPSREIPARSFLINPLYTTEVPYNIPDTIDLFKENRSLYRFGDHYFIVRETSELVYREESKTPGTAGSSVTIYERDQVKVLKQDINPDWLIAVVIGPLLILAWLKLFFHKFFDQNIVSMWNFQLGSKFLRDSGIFSRRVGWIMVFNFIIIGGLLSYLVLTHFGINPLSIRPFPAFILYASILAVLLMIRYLVTSLTGHIFDQNDYFREYLYHTWIIYKNLGIFLIPLVFCIAYIHDNLRIYFIICALILVALAFIFRFIKGIQIIIKKDVILFYLILYLCTLEILPVLFYYKFFSGWI